MKGWVIKSTRFRGAVSARSNFRKVYVGKMKLWALILLKLSMGLWTPWRVFIAPQRHTTPHLRIIALAVSGPENTSAARQRAVEGDEGLVSILDRSKKSPLCFKGSWFRGKNQIYKNRRKRGKKIWEREGKKWLNYKPKHWCDSSFHTHVVFG